MAIFTIASAPFVYWEWAAYDEMIGFIATVVFIISGLAIAVGTGLIGMLIGYVMYRKKREMKPTGVVVIPVAVGISIAWLAFVFWHSIR